MATREGKTPRKAGGGRFNTIETSTPSKGRPPAVVKPISVRPGGGLELAAAANHSVQTPKRGGALFNNASPMVEGQSGDEHAGSSTIKVFVRVRPMSSSEKSTGRTENVVSVPTTDTVVLQGSEPKPFTFDYVADSSTTQNEVFDMIGRPFTDSCLKGYNGCIFAYGQTGSGKTFTMQGPDAIDTKSEDRGLIPRTFEYLFERIAAKEAMANATKPGSLQFIVRCCYMEIYNETVTDLLEASKSNLAVRENNKDGIYVDGITWQEVRNAEACVALLERGLRNRKVGETSMNKESSRSHSLLTVRVESTRLGEDGLTKRRSSSLNLVDLAGSERQKATNASGDRLKEASNINRSLSALGNVIMALADMSDGKARHVHYRDSKLTFLLKDSLGGNSKTAIISNISPADSNFGETLSTLKFAQRAKLIKTRAILNEDTNGSLDQLRAEIKRLKAEVASSKGKGSCASVSQGSLIVSDGAGDDGGALRERISDLENLLYQCMEAQTSAENKCEQLIAIKAEALDRAEAAVKEESELFSSLKMQLKLKTESIKHLTSKKAPSTAAPADPEANAVPPDPQRVSELEREVKELKSEIDALRMAANAPITDHPEYRELHTALSRADLAMRSEGHFIVQTSSLNQGLVKLFPNPDLEQRKHLNAMAAEVRNQFMQAIKDKKELCDELAVLRASGRDDRCGSLSSSASMGAVLSPGAQARVATMTTPVRKVFENTRLQMWREEQDFDARRRLLQEELDNTKREVMALQQQLESAHRKADLASMELEELKPSLRRLSGADLGDAASEIERIAKRAAEARMSCETEKQSRQAAEAALNTSEQLAAQLAAARSELEEAGKREAKLRHQLEAAEYAVAASERRANKQQRASLAADPGRLAQLQDENEQLQVKLARLQDEYESRKEEFAFLEGKVERNTKQFAELEAAGERVAEELGSCKALLAGEQARVKDLEVQLQQVASGDGAKEGLVLALKEAEKAVAELERRLEESQKNEEELRDGLAHQQAVHEALQKEASIAQEVLKETMKTLEGKNTMLEQLHADFNDKTTEAKELSDRVDALLADLDHTNRAMEDMRRRHEALIDDREGIEHSHQAQMDEMMCELKKRQERIDALEKEVEGASQRAKKAEHRLSDVEANVSDAAKVKSENKSLQATITQRDNELFEINFEVKGMQSKIKLLETERDELQASLGEVAHVRDEQQARGDKLQQQLAAAHADLETSQQEVGKLMGEHADEQGKAQQLAAKCSALEDEMRRLQLLATQATHRAEAAEAGKAAAGEEDSGKAAELAALQSQMEGWIDDMRALKEQEEAAREECVAAAKTLKEVREEKDKVEQALGEAQARVEELNAINTKLIGHSNAKQKVQHVVKMKEENNELHVSLKKAQSELSKVKDKAEKLEKEVDKLRGALGIEGGATQVLAEEEKNRAQLAAKEQQYATLVQQTQAVLDKALALAPELGGALEAMAVCHGGGEGDGVLCERVERVLDALAKRLGDDAAELEQYKSTIKNREFENDLLKKQLQLRNPTKTPAKHLLPAAAPGGEENVHPNSPLCVSDKTPGKVGPAGTKAVGGRRSVLGQIADQ